MPARRFVLSDSLPIAEWQRLRDLHSGGEGHEFDGAAPAELDDELPMDVWQWARDGQLRGFRSARPDGARAQAVALSAPRPPGQVDEVVVTAPKPQAKVQAKAPPARTPLTGRPGVASIVAGALNTIAAGPNTSAPLKIKGKGFGVEGVITRGAGNDVHADGKLVGVTVGARGTLDPPTGRAEISASRIRGRHIGLPSSIRIYTTPTGELDVDLPEDITLLGLPFQRKGTYVIGQPDPPQRKR